MPPENPVRDGPDFQLIETLRWEPATGLLRGEHHLARLAQSAAALGFRFDAGKARSMLADAVRADRQLRLRLTLARDGAMEVEARPFTLLAPGSVWSLKIARQRLDSGDPLLRHKTTRRAHHEAARAEFDLREADEVILLNGDGLVCEGTISNVFVSEGGKRLLTPALACGLLPGVLRARLLAEGQAREAELTPADLGAASAVFVGNSLRGLIPARLG